MTPSESTTLITPVVGNPASATTTAFRLQPLASHIPDPIPDSQVVSSSKPANKGGRPKGSTNQAKEDLARRKVLATDLIARKYKEAQDVNPGKQLPRKTYERIHNEALAVHSLQNFSVKKNTIDKRIKRNSLVTRRMGPVSPVDEMEPILLTYVQWKQEAGQAMKPKELLQLANSMLQGSALQDNLCKFQQNLKKAGSGQLTKSWRKGFMARYDAFLRSKRGYHFNHLRMDDLTPNNIQAMYDMTYETWVAARVAVRLPESEWHYVDCNGNETSKESSVG